MGNFKITSKSLQKFFKMSSKSLQNRFNWLIFKCKDTKNIWITQEVSAFFWSVQNAEKAKKNHQQACWWHMGEGRQENDRTEPHFEVFLKWWNFNENWSRVRICVTVKGWKWELWEIGVLVQRVKKPNLIRTLYEPYTNLIRTTKLQKERLYW